MPGVGHCHHGESETNTNPPWGTYGAPSVATAVTWQGFSVARHFAGKLGGAGHIAGALLAPQGVATPSGWLLGNGPVTTSTASFVESVE
jgi:hypothetical protein